MLKIIMIVIFLVILYQIVFQPSETIEFFTKNTKVTSITAAKLTAAVFVGSIMGLLFLTI